jgi:alpha 1,3-glucosidase
VHIWNDMNEPACFDPFDKSMPKYNLHRFDAKNGLIVEHRDVHNVYGYYNTQATYEGLLARSKGKERPFLLSRSYFAGS